jgi:hypothetical protein
MVQAMRLLYRYSVDFVIKFDSLICLYHPHKHTFVTAIVISNNFDMLGRSQMLSLTADSSRFVKRKDYLKIIPRTSPTTLHHHHSEQTGVAVTFRSVLPCV